MPRSSTVTVIAAAVTLSCLGASFYASPPVVAETLGREVQTFSPLNPDTYPQVSNDVTHETPVAQDRPQSSTANVAPEGMATRASHEPVPTNGDDVTLAPVAADDEVPGDGATDLPAPSPPKLPRIEEALPDSTPRATAEESAGAESDLPEDLDSPDSMTVIVNKQRPLPNNYEPTDLVELPTGMSSGSHQLREEAAEATQAMLEAAQQEDIILTVVSAYRSYDYQTALYDAYIRQYGQTVTNQISARPGYSEHQTGLAIDVDTPDGQHTLKQSFGGTAAGQWLATHAHEYGFVVRYPKDEHDYTGFTYEPWHLRYFGEQYAQQIVEHSGVAEREFGLDPASDYQD